MSIVNRKLVLASRPVGMVSEENFRLEEETVREIEDGEVLLKTLYLSVDPYMRGRMNDRKSYADPVQIGEVKGSMIVDGMEYCTVNLAGKQSRNPIPISILKPTFFQPSRSSLGA